MMNSKLLAVVTTS